MERKIRNGFLLILILILCSLKMYSQDNFQLNLDYAVFQYDEYESFVELYYEISHSDVNQLIKKLDGEEWVVNMTLEISRNDTLWGQNSFELKSQLDKNLDNTKGARMISKLHFLATEGRYEIKLIAEEKFNNNLKTDSGIIIDVDTYVLDEVQMSDIELASSVEYNAEDDQNNPFYKNSVIVIPHPSMLYGTNQRFLYYYIEMYNLLSGILYDKYKIYTTILDNNENQVHNFNPIIKNKKRQVDSIVDAGEINVTRFQSGTYYLNIEITDPSGEKVAGKKKKFFVYNPDIEKVAATSTITPEKRYNLSPFASMDDSQINKEYEYVGILIDQKLEKIYKECSTIESRRQFLFNFWSSMDPDKETLENSAYNGFKMRVKYANDNYSSRRVEGWSSDIGKVFIKYGVPSEIERYPNTEGGVPYQIWSYHEIEGGVIFVFANMMGRNDFTLLHSTKRGETYYPDYERLLERGRRGMEDDEGEYEPTDVYRRELDDPVKD